MLPCTRMIGMATTALGLGLALYISLQAYNQGMVLFSWHPILMSGSALFLSTAGIQAVRSRHAVGGMQPKTQRVQVRERYPCARVSCMPSAGIVWLHVFYRHLMLALAVTRVPLWGIVFRLCYFLCA